MDNKLIKEIRLGDLMVNSGYITEQQLMEALALQKQDRSKRIGQILIEQGYVQERQMLTALADRLQTSLIDIATYPVEEEAVKTIPIQMAQQYLLLPVSLQEGLLTVAMNDPLNLYAIEDLRQTTGMNIHSLLAESQPLKDAITYHYAAIKTKQAAANASENASASETQEVIIDANATADDAPIINLVNSLLDKAYQDGVSDVHIEPFEKEILVRMRTDGVLLNYITLNKNVQNALVARIKIIGELDIAERRVPQDGHFRIRIRDQIVNVRVSVIPTVFGEKVVMRILASNSDIDHSDTFGMTPNNYQKFIKMLKSPNGLIYITGPTGSGKTTTLYMALGSLATKPVNISTIEDPVEKNLAHLNQMQVHPTAGLTFEVGLRALLRQDPDVIMVGETRDPETASISLRAAITGHLVLSTLHTNDAVSTIIRLIDMGAEPYLLSSALVGAVAQRLLRKVCPYCGQVVGLNDAEREFAGRDIPTAKKAMGCAKCHNTGYSGRIAVHEVLVADKMVRSMIAAGATAEEITKYAIEYQGMESIKMAALRLLEEGVTTMEEVQRIAYNE